MSGDHVPDLPAELLDVCSKKDKEEEEEEFLPALFWDGNEKVDESHPDFAAMKALQDEMTPTERCNSFKEQGNDIVKHKNNKYYLRNAVICYTKALYEQCGDTVLESQCYSNRAHAQILLGNNRKAVEDCVEALKLNANNVKACFRGAKASSSLEDPDKAISFCQMGLKVEPDNAELMALLSKVKNKMEKDNLAKELLDQRVKSAREKAEEMAQALVDRNVALSPSHTHVEGGQHRPYLDSSRLLHWRVGFLYPETRQSDTIQDACEADTLDDHLDVIFDDSEPPAPWDPDRVYSRSRVRLFYEKNNATPMKLKEVMKHLLRGSAADGKGVEEDFENFDYTESAAYCSEGPRWVEVDTSKALGEVLSEKGNVLPGYPVFHVVALGTETYELFKQNKWKIRR